MSSIDENFGDALKTALIMERSHMSGDLQELNAQLTDIFNSALRSKGELMRMASAAVRQKSYQTYVRGSFTVSSSILEQCSAIKELKGHFKDSGHPIKNISLDEVNDRGLPPCAILTLNF